MGLEGPCREGPGDGLARGLGLGTGSEFTSMTDDATSRIESSGLAGRPELTSMTLTSDEGTAVMEIPAGRFGCLNCVGPLVTLGFEVPGGELLRSTTSSSSSSTSWYKVDGISVDTSL